MSRRTPSESNPFYLPKNMYLTAVRYCLQYPELKRQLAQLQATAGMKAVAYTGMPHGSGISSPTEQTAILIAEIERKIKVIETAVKETSPELYKWLLIGVTRETNYDYLRHRKGMPCGYRQYHKAKQAVYHKISQAI